MKNLLSEAIEKFVEGNKSLTTLKDISIDINRNDVLKLVAVLEATNFREEFPELFQYWNNTYINWLDVPPTIHTNYDVVEIPRHTIKGDIHRLVIECGQNHNGDDSVYITIESF